MHPIPILTQSCVICASGTDAPRTQSDAPPTCWFDSRAFGMMIGLIGLAVVLAALFA